MNLSLTDWLITAALFVGLAWVAHYTRRYSRSVADFLAAGRCAGRYLICISEGMAALGATSIVAAMQMYYEVGFASIWWNCMILPVTLMIVVTGFITFRFRQTRALTMAQFLEMRYSRRFRIFAGMMAFSAGAINFGVFPAIGATFFIHYCGFPPSIGLLPTFPLVVAVLLVVSLYFVFVGGQISVMTTDFLQGMFCNIVLLTIVVVLLLKFSLTDVFDTLVEAPAGKSMLNPFDLAANRGYTVWFFIIMLFLRVYNFGNWPQSQGYQCSAVSAHEAKMANVLSEFRWWAFVFGGMMLPALCAYTVMNSPQYAGDASEVSRVLTTINNEEIQSQMTTPVVLSMVLPRGLCGLLAAAVFAAFVSTCNTQLHSWGSILIQDVFQPIYKKQLSPEKHILLLRAGIIIVAVVAFTWSCLFQQTQRIRLFLVMSGAIYLAGAGAVILGGLYWKRGTTAGAWTGMIVGSGLAIFSLIIEQVWKRLYGVSFPLDFKWMTVISSVSALTTYIVVSLATSHRPFNMDRMLHRGEWALPQDGPSADTSREPARWSLRRIYGITNDFTLGDKIIYACSIFRSYLLFAVVAAVSIIAAIYGFSTRSWATVHYYFLLFTLVTGFAVAIWLTIGGLRDLKRLFTRLKSIARDELDDGVVRDRQQE